MSEAMREVECPECHGALRASVRIVDGASRRLAMADFVCDRCGYRHTISLEDD